MNKEVPIPEVSIIVPVYKVEPYLRRCVESILAQTFTDFELILVDDGSPDNCGKICDELASKDKRIHVIHKPNGGLSSARNAGLDVCSGKYILFCDSDDTVEPDWCELLYKAVTANPDRFIVCNVERIRGDAKREKRDPKSHAIEECTYFELYKKGVSPYAWNKIYSKAKIDELGLRFDESVIYAEDVPFTTAYAASCDQCCFLPERLNHYYQIEGSIMNRYNVDLLALHLPLFSARLRLIKDDQMAEYCGIWFYHFCNLFENIFDPRNKGMTFLEKMRYNQNVIRTREFQFCLKHADLSKENSRLVSFLKSGNYYLYWAYVAASKVVRLIRKDRGKRQ